MGTGNEAMNAVLRSAVQCRAQAQSDVLTKEAERALPRLC